MDLAARFRAHVEACKAALEPKEVLASRLNAHFVAEINARFDEATREHSVELGKARQLAAEERQTREKFAEDTILKTKSSCADIAARRDSLREEALVATDIAAAAEDEAFWVRARRKSGAHRASLMEIKLRNANEVSELRARLEQRVADAFARLQLAVARAPFKAERLRDAMKRRRGNAARRQIRDRKAARAVKDAVFKLRCIKSCYAESEKTNARQEGKLRLATFNTMHRVDSMRSIHEKATKKNPNNAILFMKRARIEKLKRELDAVETELWQRTLACDKPVFAKRASLDDKCRAFNALEKALRQETNELARNVT
jgi:hypothetical protein